MSGPVGAERRGNSSSQPRNHATVRTFSGSGGSAGLAGLGREGKGSSIHTGVMPELCAGLLA